MRVMGMYRVLILFVITFVVHFTFANNIRPGDVLGIHVAGQPELSMVVPVSRDGTISYPYLGTAKVAGLTVEQVKTLIEQGLRKVLREPIVTVYIKEYAPVLVYVQGAINKAFDISRMTNITLTRLLSLIGLENLNEIDLSNVKLIRSGRTQNYNLASYFYFGTSIDDPQLMEGDIIYLAPASFASSVIVAGAVSKTIPYIPGLTVRMLLSQIGPLNFENAIPEETTLITSGKTFKINLLDVIAGNVDYSLAPGSYLLIPLRQKQEVYVTGFVVSPGAKELLPGEQPTLGLALAKAGGIPAGAERYVEAVEITFRDGKTFLFPASKLNELIDFKLESGTIVNVRRLPSFKVYVINDFDEASKTTSQAMVEFDPDEPRTLWHLLAKVGVLQTDKVKWLQSVKVNGAEVKKEDFENVVLKDKDVVEIRRYPEFGVYLIGDLQTSDIAERKGKIYFEPSEPKTLQQLLVKIGGLKTNELKWIQSVTVNGKPVDLSKAEQVILSKDDVVEIRKFPEFQVYVTGDFFDQTIVRLDPDEPKNLEHLFVKLGGLKTEQLRWIESVKLNGQLVDLSKLSKYELNDKDVVEVKKYPEFYAYAHGFVTTKGKITFDPDENKTLKTLLAKVGLPDDEVENEGIAIINNETKIALRELLHGSKDVPLSHGDLVQVTYEPFIVSVVGTSAGTVQLSYKEPRTLSYLVKKVGITDPEAVEKIVLVRSGKSTEYDVKEIIFGNVQVPLNRLDTVVIKPALENAVYVTGDVAGYITFPTNESITLQKVISKVGLNDLRKVDKIIVEGKEISKESDTQLQRGCIINILLKNPILVTAMGYIRTTGRVTFEYYETADLRTLFAKLGGLIINPEDYYSSDTIYVIRDGRVIESFKALEVHSGAKNIELKDGDFVYVTESLPKQVYVFGKGMPNGLVRFTVGEEFDLRTLIGKLGGMRDGVSKNISIIDGEKVQTIAWNEYVNMKLTANAIVLFDVDKENFIYVIDADGKPDMFYTDRVVTLYEVLTRAGLNKNYRKIEITSGTQKQTVQLRDISQARSYTIKPGDVVRILDTPENFAYVLGEVNRPGIVTLSENTTVLQAIIQAGYFTQKAVPSSVWLYKGGVNGKPIRVNLQAAVSGGNIEFNPIVEPGDVIFVPTDMFRTALEWIPIINNLIQFYNNISSILK